MGAAPYQPEMETKDFLGIRRAAKRKLQHELGLSLHEDDLQFLTRIIYLSPSHNDPVWGEYEGKLQLLHYIS